MNISFLKINSKKKKKSIVLHRVLTIRDSSDKQFVYPQQNQSNITTNQKRVWAEPLWKSTALNEIDTFVYNKY